MPNFEELLLREQKNPNAAIIQFFLSEYASEDVVVIVEGADDPIFYYDFISEYLAGQSLFFFPCGGKLALLKFKEFIVGYGLSPKPKKMLFLTDKDFDDLLNRVPIDVFQTEYYSIENYFSCPEFFAYVLRRHGAGKVKNAHIEKLVRQFGELLRVAIERLIVPMAFICALREKGVELDLDNISCADLIYVEEGTGSLKSRTARGEAVGKTLYDSADGVLECASIRRFASTLTEQHYNTWLRGKYALQLMRLILRSLAITHHSAPAVLQALIPNP